MKKVRQVRSLASLWRYRSELFHMFGDMFARRYRASFLTIVALVAGLLYILSPIDLIPDFIPFIGWVDDGFVFYFLLKRLMYELQRYDQYLSQRKGTGQQLVRISG
jgi:uncharacterized membrane protein YkvA (DUF1232 family)